MTRSWTSWAILLVGLSLAGAARADALDWLYAECAPGSEFRLMFREVAAPVKASRLYAGCRDPDSLVESAYYADLNAAQKTQLRAIGSRAMTTSRTWTKPASFTVPVFLKAVTTCDRYWLWARDEGARAPKMTRAQKLKQACG